jgi:DNA-binding response OmpR family regulator
MVPDSASPLPIDVLVVEDDTPIQQVIIDVLGDANIRAEACPFGWQAHRCIRNAQPKVVILDVQLPKVSGIDLFYLLHADPSTFTIPVIFLTVNPQRVHSEIPNYREMGAVVMGKPFRIDALVATVRSTLAA